MHFSEIKTTEPNLLDNTHALKPRDDMIRNNAGAKSKNKIRNKFMAYRWKNRNPSDGRNSF